MDIVFSLLKGFDNIAVSFAEIPQKHIGCHDTLKGLLDMRFIEGDGDEMRFSSPSCTELKGANVRRRDDSFTIQNNKLPQNTQSI